LGETEAGKKGESGRERTRLAAPVGGGGRSTGAVWFAETPQRKEKKPDLIKRKGDTLTSMGGVGTGQSLKAFPSFFAMFEGGKKNRPNC